MFSLVIPPKQWNYLLDQLKVAAVMEGKKDINWFTDECWAIASLTDLERRVLQPPPLLTANQRQKADDHQTVLAILLAREAGREKAVMGFRERILGGRVLSAGRVETWLTEQATKDGKPTVWLQDVAVPSGYEVRDVPYGSEVFTEPGLSITQKHPARASSRMVACALIGRPPRAFMTRAGGVLEELRELSQRLSRQFGWAPMQATLFVLTDEVPTVPLAHVSIEASSSRPACTRIILDVDPTATPNLVAERYRQRRKELFPRRVRSLSRRHLNLAAFVAEHPGEHVWPELFAEWNRKHPKWKYQRRNIFKRDSLRARMRVLTLGMPDERWTYSEDEGKLVPLRRIDGKSGARRFRATRSAKQRTQNVRRSRT
jgi:hypothetical protein